MIVWSHTTFLSLPFLPFSSPLFSLLGIEIPTGSELDPRDRGFFPAATGTPSAKDPGSRGPLGPGVPWVPGSPGVPGQAGVPRVPGDS